MSKLLRCGFAAAAIVLCSQGVLAQPVNGCPAGQAMQSSDPSGRKVTCVAVPDVSALGARIDAAAAEPNIVGRWAMTGSTTCLQSTAGFDANFTPNLAAGQTFVSHLTGTVNAVRTFNANGTGHTLGVTHTLSHPQLLYRPGFAPIVGNNAGSVTMSTLDTDFTWTIQADGNLLIDDNNAIPQRFLLPTTRSGWTVVIRDVPSFIGHISKDRRTIVLTHNTMQIEASQVTDDNGTAFLPSPRFCARDRILTRLTD
jgi:hypothetical protein